MMRDIVEPGCVTSAFKPEQFEVAVDRESGIAFIHTPCGWSLLGVLRSATIDEDLVRSKAKPVPRAVLAAAIILQPWLANYQPKPALREQATVP